MQTDQTTHPETQNEPTTAANDQPAPQASGLKPQVSIPPASNPPLSHLITFSPSHSPSSNEPTETQNEPTTAANDQPAPQASGLKSQVSIPPLSHVSTFSPSHSPSPNEPTDKPPISEARLKANRANAQKSTGPRTPAGKRRSRMNALKHGLLAWATILYDDKNDHPTEMAPLLADLTDALQPRDRYEELLVERIACTHWRLRRLYRYEVDAVAESRMRSNLPWAQVSRGLIGITQDPAPAQLPGADHFDRILRYEAVIQRELRHLDQEVLRLKQLRLKERELRLKEKEHSMDTDDSHMSPDDSPSVSPSPTRPLTPSPSRSDRRQTNPPESEPTPDDPVSPSPTRPLSPSSSPSDPVPSSVFPVPSGSSPRQTNPPQPETPPVPDAAPDPLAKALEMVAAGFRNLRPNLPTPAPKPVPPSSFLVPPDSSPRQTNPPPPDSEPAPTDHRLRPKTIWNNHIKFMGP